MFVALGERVVMPTKAEKRAKEIQKRAQHIVDRAADVKDIEAQAKLIELRAHEIENEVITRTLNTPINARSDFSNKEVYLLLLDEMNKKLDSYIISFNEKMEKHDALVKQISDKYLPIINKHTDVLDQVCKDLPDKGFCGRVDKMYDELHPKNDTPLHEKVQTLWYDRKILKWVLAASIGALIVSITSLLLKYALFIT